MELEREMRRVKRIEGYGGVCIERGRDGKGEGGKRRREKRKEDEEGDGRWW